MDKTLLYIAVMALVTYLVRMLPFVLFRKKITSGFWLGFLHYIPYAVLSVMTIPDIFYSTGEGNIIPAIAGFVVAVLLSYFDKKLLTVAVSACITVYFVNLIIRLI